MTGHRSIIYFYGAVIVLSLQAGLAATAAGLLSPTIQIASASNQAVLTFSGTLESATNTIGPWDEVANAASPLRLAPAGARRFFRTRDGGSIFSSKSVTELTITAPLQTHFDMAYAGMPDGIFPPKRLKPYFDATVQASRQTVPASLRVRGNSSLQECPFPKLKMKVSKDNRVGTPFADAREIKIGTHCAEGGRGNIGRLRDERATYREALAYEAMDLLGFVSPRVRRARIHFLDTSPTNAPNPGGWQITRNGMILDGPEVVAERLGGRALEDDEILALTNANFNEQLIADLEFLHALLGNWDYKLSLDGTGLWNTDVIELANGTKFPVAGDFDLCSWVTEQVRSSVPREYHPELPVLEREARYKLEGLQARFKGAIYDTAKARFQGRRAGLEVLVQSAEVDEDGRANAMGHLQAFFSALSQI